MLVLTRKQQDQIQISDNIRITVLKIQGQTVRIGIEAPKDIRIVRGELTLFEGEPTLASIAPPPATATPVRAAQPVVDMLTSPRVEACSSGLPSEPSALHALVSRRRLNKRAMANFTPHFQQ